MRIRLFPKSFINSQNKLDSNCRPLSVVMTAGTSKRDTQPAMNVFAVVTASILIIGRTSHQREKRSKHVNKYAYPSQGDKGPVMSMCTCSNRSSRDRKGSTGVQVCLLTLAF